MSRDEVLFDVPVYRLSERERLEETESLKLKDVRYTVTPGWDGPWRYNEVIAWVAAWQDGSSVKFDRYERRMQRYQRHFDARRPLLHMGRLTEAHLLADSTSSAIWAEIRDRLDALVSHYQDRYVDLRQVERWGPHLDWRRVLGFEVP